MDKSELKKKLGKLRKTSAKIKNSDGSVFVGMTKKVGDKLIPHGLGFTRWPTNHSYDGQFKNGKWHGKFKITFPDGEVMYANFNMGNYIEK